MPNITVFGANGFIGKALVKKLAQNKENFIRAFDRFPEYSAGMVSDFDHFNNIEIFPGNFLNREDVARAVKDTDYVFHLVSTTNPALSAKDPYIDIDTNIRGSVSLFEICAQSKVKRVIFPSSGGTVYGNIDSDLIDESTVPRPVSPYGIGKLTIEHYLRYFKQTAGLDYIVYRIANPYGPGQNVYGKQGVVPIFLHACLAREAINVYGDGSMVRDYLYIDDLINMIATSFDKEHRHSTYNLGSGEGYSVNDLVSSIRSCTHDKVMVEHNPVPPTFVHKSVLDISRFVDEFDYTPRTKLSEGIALTWQYVKSL